MADSANTNYSIIFLILLILFLIIPIFLQIFLSKRESPIPGLIIPGLSLLFSIITVLSMVMFENQSTMERITSILFPLMITNIPTVVHLAIYFACREKFRKRKQMDKMNIHDL